MKLSVIIPVYNKQEYIEQGLLSVLHQDCDDYEVVAVDDGSTDGSGRLCDRMAASHPRLKVIHVANGGVTAARKIGVAQSEGRYVTFMDADDEMLPGGLRTLCEAIERTDADEVVATYVTQHGEQVTSGIVGWADTDRMISELLGSRARFCVLWAVIFKRELLDGCLDTPRIIRSGEDILMQILCLLKNPKVYFIADSVYRYTVGLPNDRRLALEEQKAYDCILEQALRPRWDRWKDDFTLRQIKMYENFISERNFAVYRQYYAQVRKRVNGRIPWTDRLAILLPPRLAYFPIRWKKK